MKLSIKNVAANQNWVPLLIVGFTAVFRLTLLAIKPPHFDEGINGWFVDQMVKDGCYHYDPANYHGPLHFYILYIFKILLGRNLWALRLPTVIVSTLTVWLVTKFDRFIDRRGCWITAAAMAVSPAMEFYGRYAIHEAEMTFFLILGFWGAAGIWRFGGMKYLWAAALGATGMVLTKETYIIHFTALLLAAPCLLALERFLPGREAFPREPRPDYSQLELLLAGGVCAGLIVFFYSGNLLDFSLLKGLYLTFGEWVKTGQGNQSGHEKVWWYWFKLIACYEWPVAAGMIFSLLYIWPLSSRPIRYLMIYGWGTFTAYSIVHYKTPWCIITIMWPFLFVFGDLISRLLRTKLTAAAAALVVTPLLAANFYVSARLSFFRYTDEKEDYVYVQTFNDINKLTGPLLTLAARNPMNYHLKGYVVMDSSYPIPWVLGDFTDVSYYEKDLPALDNMDAAFLLLDDDHEDDAQKLLKKNYFIESFHLRSSQDPVNLYLDYDTFREFFPNRKADFIQGVAVPADSDTGAGSGTDSQ